MVLGLESDLAVVGEADDGAAALDLARNLAPDVVVMDVAMPAMDGITATIELRRVAPRSAVVVHSLDDDPLTQARAEAAGAVAFVAKHRMEAPLLAAIRLAAAQQPALQ